MKTHTILSDETLENSTNSNYYFSYGDGYGNGYSEGYHSGNGSGEGEDDYYEHSGTLNPGYGLIGDI